MWEGPRNPGADALKRIRREVTDEIEAMASDLLDRAKRDAPRLSPEEHARRHPGQPPLAETGFAEVHPEADRIVGTVGFRAFYAAWQEERRDYKHDDGKAGYLGDNLKALVPEYLSRLKAAQVRGVQGG